MKYFLFLSLISGSLFAQNLTKIQADYRCEDKGGGIAFKDNSTGLARIWQTDVGEKKGLELKVVDFRMARCPGCYDFEAKLMGEINVRGIIRDFKLTYELQDPETSLWSTVLKNVTCKRAN